MTSAQIARVRESWTLLLPIAATFASDFYRALFVLDPSLQRLFAHSDAVSQQRKLMQTLTVVVASLDDIDALVPALEALARRHVGYGALDAHYDLVGQALIATIAAALGARFDDQTREAWEAVYATLARVMRRAAIASSPRVS